MLHVSWRAVWQRIKNTFYCSIVLILKYCLQVFYVQAEFAFNYMWAYKKKNLLVPVTMYLIIDTLRITHLIVLY